MTDIKVLILCHSPTVRSKIEELLLACADVRIVGSTGAHEDILRVARRTQPDVLVIHAAGSEGFQADLLFRLKQVQPNLKTLMLGCPPDQARIHFAELAPWGLRGWICNWEGSSELVDALYALRNDDFYLCPVASHVLVDAYRDMHHQLVRR
ncbi:MAG: response regulator transcription factor [Chloroflexi bacterium]|nr:response regulator transcription factor [Chloroflexota bacterium]